MKSRNALTLRPGSLEQPYSSALLRADEDKFIKRLFSADAPVYGKTGDALKSIENRLMNLSSTPSMPAIVNPKPAPLKEKSDWRTRK